MNNWNVSKVTSMKTMFVNCQSLKSIEFSNWNTQNLSTTYGMFSGCSLLEELDLTNWNTKKVKDFSRMFRNCSSLTQILVGSNWSTVSATTVELMFDGCGVSEVTTKTT